MSLIGTTDGYYDEGGAWVRTKLCFTDCGVQCTCKPPSGIYQLSEEALSEQLCRSNITDGSYDDFIKDKFEFNLSNVEIIDRVMKESRGLENPKLIDQRINKLRSMI